MQEPYRDRNSVVPSVHSIAGVTLLFLMLTAQASAAQARNSAPRAGSAIGEVTARLGDEATRFDLSDYFTDPDGDHLVYRVANPAIVTVAVTGSMMAVTPVAVGTGAATVRATDPLGLHVEQTFTVTVSAADSAPVVTHPIADMTLTVGGRSETVTLSSHFQDPEQGELTFSASSGDTAVSTATVTDDVLTVTAAAAGSASVTVRASDQNGLTSAPAVFTVIGKSPVNVEIPDANLRPVVEQELGKEPGETITSAEMEHIRALEGTELDIEDLRGLEFATGLTDLNLGINAISDLTPLSGLTNLRNLGLRENAITDVTPVSDLTNLEEVDLDHNSLTDLTPLSGLANLIGLGLDWNSLTDVTPLSGLTSLTTLSLDHNSLTDLTPLSGLTNLTRLGLVNNSITDVAPLSGLTGLTDLYLLYNSITDVTPLSGLTGLTDLYLSNNSLTDLTPLSGMTNLTRLSLFNNEIRDVTPLSGLTNLNRLWLYDNCLTSIQALTNNGGLGAGDYISLRWNALDADTVADDVTALRDRGVDVVITETPAVEVGAPVNLSASPGDGELTLTWAASSGPDVPAYEVRWRSAAGTFNDWTVVPCSSKRRHKLTGLVNGTAYTVELRAAGHADNGVATVGATSGDPFNNAPVVTLSIADVTLTVGDEPAQISLSDHFTDPDGDSLEYSVVAPDIVTVAVTESAMTVTPVAVGTGAATARATDPGGLYAELTFTVTVSAADSAPVVTHPIADMRLTVGGRSETVTLLSHFQDPEQGELTFAASSGDAAVVTAALADGVLTVTAVAAGTTEVTVTASDVSGSVSEPDVFTVTSESPVTVEIPDANLRAAVERELGKQAGEPISSAEMEHMNGLYCEECSIESLIGLQFATGLTWLELGDNAIRDLTPLSGLTNLTGLVLYMNEITDVSPLSGLINLAWLELSENAIAGVTPLSALVELEALYLDRNCLANIDSLVSNTGLGDGDYISLEWNALDADTLANHVPALRDRGATVRVSEMPSVEKRGAPVSLKATAGDGELTLAWAPRGYGGNFVVYEVRWRSATGTFTDWEVVPCSSRRRHRLTGLVNGMSYTVEVRAAGHADNGVATVSAMPSGLGATEAMLWADLTAPRAVPDVSTGWGECGISAYGAWPMLGGDGSIYQPPLYLRELYLSSEEQSEMRLSTSRTGPVSLPSGTVRERMVLAVHDAGLEEVLVGSDGAPLVSMEFVSIGNGWFTSVGGTISTVCDVLRAGPGQYDRNGGLYVELTVLVERALSAGMTPPNAVPEISLDYGGYEIRADGAWPMLLEDGTIYEPPVYVRELRIIEDPPSDTEQVRIRLSASSTESVPPPLNPIGGRMLLAVHDRGLEEVLVSTDGSPLVTAEMVGVGSGWFSGRLAGDTRTFWAAFPRGPGQYDWDRGLYVDLTFSALVSPANEAPVVMLPIDDMTLTVGGLWETVNLASHFRDTVEEELTYAASSGEPAVVSAVVADGVLTVTAVTVGSAAVTVTASDPSGLSSDEVFTVVAQSPVNVEIPDAGLRAAVESELGKDAGATISSAEMEFVDSLEGIGWNIEDLTGLEFATGLTELELGDNAITDIAPLSGLTNLRDLHLYVNALTDVTLLSGLTGLASVDLSDNEITEVAPLSGLTGLTSVDLSGNEITDVTPLSGLTNLTQLFLGRNQITDVTPLAGLTNLTRLHLRSNQITDVTPLSGLTNLTQLDLYNNALTDATPLAGLTNLTSLFFSSNALTDVSVLSGLSKLRTLFVSDDMLTDVSALSGLSKLTSLSLSSDALADVSALSGLTNLRGLWLSGSALTEVSALSGLTTLTQLDLSESAVTDIAPLSGLSSLIWLSLSHNEITEVTPVSGLTNLKLLDLTNNTITDIAPLSGLSSLTTLNLSHNEITDVTPLSGLTSLRWLYLDSNCLTNIEALTSNTGLGGGDYISLEWNALDADTLTDDVTALRDRGATVEVSETPSDEIGAPTGLSATPGDHELALTWDSPWIQGHVTYNVRWRSAAGTFNDWTVVPCSSKRRYKLTGLTNGTTYTVEVRAAGHADNGVASVSATPND